MVLLLLSTQSRKIQKHLGLGTKIGANCCWSCVPRVLASLFWVLRKHQTWGRSRTLAGWVVLTPLELMFDERWRCCCWWLMTTRKMMFDNLYISLLFILFFFDFLLPPSRIKFQGTCLLAYCALPSRSAEWPKGFGKFMASWLIAGGCMYQVTIFRLGSGHWLVWVLNKWSYPWSLVKGPFVAMMFLVGIVSCKTCARNQGTGWSFKSSSCSAFWSGGLFFDVWIVWGMHFWGRTSFFWCPWIVDCFGKAGVGGVWVEKFGWPHLKPS